MTYPRTETKAKRSLVLPVVVALISGLIFGLVGAYIFVRPGPKGFKANRA